MKAPLLPLLLLRILASTKVVIQLQLPTIPEISTRILDAKYNVAEEVEVLEIKSVNISIYWMSRNRLGVSKIAISSTTLSA